MHPLQLVLPILCVLNFSSQFKMAPIIIPGSKRYAFSSCLLLRGEVKYGQGATTPLFPPPKK
jgi:hypothetical protein